MAMRLGQGYGNSYQGNYHRLIMADKQTYTCPKGHYFETDAPIIIAVDNDPEYNSGVVCPYCYVNWFRLNVSAEASSKAIDLDT